MPSLPTLPPPVVGSQEKDPRIDFVGVLQSVCAEGPPEVATRWQPCRRVHGAPSTAQADSRPDPFRQGRVGGPWVPLPELLALATRSVVPKVNRGHSPKPPNSRVRRSALSGINVPQIDRTVRSIRTIREPTTHIKLMNAQQLGSSAFRGGALRLLNALPITKSASAPTPNPPSDFQSLICCSEMAEVADHPKPFRTTLDGISSLR